MKLDSEFIKLPLRFDPTRLAEELSQFGEGDWKPHPQGYAGNSALSLVAVGGDPLSDQVKGPMRPTPFLARTPYLRQVLASLHAPVGRTRLMRIEGEGEAHAHVDTNFYWFDRVRVHIPLLTYPEVEFLCGGKSVNMAAGECWLFDTWRNHNVLNHVPLPRVHLVADTVGSEAFWDLADRGERPFATAPCPVGEPEFVPFDPSGEAELEFESFNGPVVISPWEVQVRVSTFLAEVVESGNQSGEHLDRIREVLLRFQRRWRALWAVHGESESGWPLYRSALDHLNAQLERFKSAPLLPNNVALAEAVRQAVTRPGLNPGLAAGTPRASEPARLRADEPGNPREADNGAVPAYRFDRPVFVLAAPRSGSSFLFETLSRSPTFWTVGGESHGIFEGITRLAPSERDYDSNRLTAADADPETAGQLRANFLAKLRDRNGTTLPALGQIRLLEKTPKNALRVPFLRAVFPDARFIFLYREPNENLSSILEAWKSGRFVTYRHLPGWQGPPWSMVLLPGWRDLIGKPLPEIAAHQWATTNETILNDLADLPRDRWITVTYSDFVKNPQGESHRICAFAGAEWDQELRAGGLPLSKHTLTPPHPEKWRANEAALAPVMPIVEPTRARVCQVLAPRPAVPAAPAPVQERTMPSAYEEVRPKKQAPAAAPATNGANPTKAPSTIEVRTSHTPSFVQILEKLGVSLMVTTYQAGKLFLVRADEGKLNLHFRSFSMPMGLALDRRRLVVGTKLHIHEYRNQPEVARKLDPVGKHDGAFLPRSSHCTGDIRVHELAIANRELWIVNTRFSCLCTLDDEHSFVPRWRPSFVTALAAEDRCHLNGLAVVNGRPRYVTCLGQTDTEGGWRENKKDGGLLLDVEGSKVMLRGLSMPHSPRWHKNQLWLLESGEGSLARVDLKAKKCKTVATMPGFTRGIDFVDDLAFVGLSQVRETAVFSGIPITDRMEERSCGVWVVDLREGKTVGFLRFDSGVREIFAVQALPGLRFPDLIQDEDATLSNSFMIPRESLAEVPAKVKA